MVKILCAAIWYNDNFPHKHQPTNILKGYVVSGWRHCCCIQTNLLLSGQTTKTKDVQGFLTSNNRFVDRKEAGEIAFAAKQTKTLITCLTSEDLY